MKSIEILDELKGCLVSISYIESFINENIEILENISEDRVIDRKSFVAHQEKLRKELSEYKEKVKHFMKELNKEMEKFK